MKEGLDGNKARDSKITLGIVSGERNRVLLVTADIDIFNNFRYVYLVKTFLKE